MADWSKTQKFDSQHVDVIHDLAYDYYGKRLATCSSDRNIQIWDQNDTTWVKTSSWEAHRGSIWRLAWAHPEFGQVLASCGFDGQVIIWEEHEKGERFQKVCEVCKFQSPVVDIKFSPRHLGLKLATGWVDGVIRIYEAMDVMNLSQWSMMEEFEMENKSKERERACHISWNPSFYDPPSFVVGCGDGSIRIFQYHESLRKWDSIEFDNDCHSDSVHDISWAPHMGRSYHLIASASKDKTVKIWKVVLTDGKWQSSLLHSSTEHNSEVWRAEWNITGTILASSGDDGKVRLWKSTNANTWSMISCISADDK